MIATLRGTVAEKIADMVVLDVQGVGYGLLTTMSEFVALNIGAQTKLYVYENIKEDAHNLIGFSSLDSKNLFEQLLSVKNVGPKVALALLNIGSTDTVRTAIADGDVKLLQTAKGVGKRAAEQVVVELRDKVGRVVGDQAEAVIGRGGVNVNDEAAQALIALGYSDADAIAALKGVDGDLPVEDRIRQALRGDK